MTDLPVEIVDPLTYPAWDDLVLETQAYSFFLSSAWARVLAESYAYKPMFFCVMDSGRIVGLIALMEIRSLITGRRAVSLPFSDYCEPILQDANLQHRLISAIRQQARKRAWRTVEFRGGNGFSTARPCALHYHHTIDLSGTENELFASFRDSTRRNVRKAVRQGVSCSHHNSMEFVRVFYQLHCLTRRRHGLPPQPFRFFRKLQEHILAHDKGMVMVCSYRGNPIAAGVFLFLGDKALYKYGASSLDYQSLRPNNLLFWEAMKWCSQQGCQTLSLGRTDPRDKGLLQFKRGWGTTETITRYFRWDLMDRSPLPSGAASSRFQPLLKRLPLALLKSAGTLLYRHMG